MCLVYFVFKMICLLTYMSREQNQHSALSKLNRMWPLSKKPLYSDFLPEKVPGKEKNTSNCPATSPICHIQASCEVSMQPVLLN